MKPINPDGFEAMFQGDADPWNYAASPFEARKRAVLLRACGPGPFGRGLELACANGETSRRLARRCLGLVAVDSSPTVIAAARANVCDPRVRFAVARLPQQTPRGPFDLIVASELIYYMPRRDMDRLIDRMASAVRPGGRVVLLHHTVRFADAAQDPRRAQRLAERRLITAGFRPVLARDFARYRVAALVRPRRGPGDDPGRAA